MSRSTRVSRRPSSAASAMEPLGRPAASALAGSPVSENARDRWRLRREGAELLPRRRRRIPRRLCATPRWTETTCERHAESSNWHARVTASPPRWCSRNRRVRRRRQRRARSGGDRRGHHRVRGRRRQRHQRLLRPGDRRDQPARPPDPRAARSRRGVRSESPAFGRRGRRRARAGAPGWRSPSPVSTSPPSSPTTIFKGTPGLGNALVSYLVGSTFLFGGAAVGPLRRSSCSRCSRASRRSPAR